MRGLTVSLLVAAALVLLAWAGHRAQSVGPGVPGLEVAAHDTDAEVQPSSPGSGSSATSASGVVRSGRRLFVDRMSAEAAHKAAAIAGADVNDVAVAYAYMFDVYKHADACTDGVIRSGHISIGFNWSIDANGTGPSDGMDLSDDDTVPDEQRDLFIKCVSAYVSDHPVHGLRNSTQWGVQTDFPLEEEAVVRLARGEMPLTPEQRAQLEQ